MTKRNTDPLAFSVDVDFCTGCKACQIACKNKNELPAGLLWRKVVEVQGGDWIRQGEAWVDNTFIYFLSLSCMHCQRPICVEVCPTQACQKREDGIVFIDSDICIGCSYCEMACPYGAPRFNAEKGVMTKCDMCRDNIDAGIKPECVMACQMRILDAGEISTLTDPGGDDPLYPLPDPGLTEPSLILKKHKRPEAMDPRTAKIGNREEL